MRGSKSGLSKRPQLHGITTNDNEREGPEDSLSGYTDLFGTVELNGNTDKLDTISPQYRSTGNSSRKSWKLDCQYTVSLTTIYC